MESSALIDAHCHLNLFEDPKTIIREAMNAGVKALICSGDSAKDCLACLDLADAKTVFATIGIGPDFAKEDFSFIDKLEQLARQNDGKVVGIGEIGLDAKVESTSGAQVQEAAFAKQIEIANSLRLPIVIHSRNRLERVMAILEEHKPYKAMFHFFEGTASQAKELAEKGYYISIPARLNSERKKIISTISISSIVVETDSPVAGKSPVEIVGLVDEIAKIRNVDKEAVASGIAQNIRNLFNI